MTYLRNSWYGAAWADEVKPGALFHRTLLDEQILIFRDSSGTAHALTDRCPHRFAPLHLGKLRGDTIQCGYHGLEFDRAGRCVLNPHGPIPQASHVRSYPLAERFSMLWIWMGESSLADVGRIPDFGFQDPERYSVGKGYMSVRANYMLEIDNIMDLSHIQFLHPTTLGSDSVAKGRYEAKRDQDTVWSKRSTHAEILSEFAYKFKGIKSGTPCDRTVDVRWDAPSNMALFASVVPTGQPRTAEDIASQAHIFTPETAVSTHYWFGTSFPKAMGERGASLAKEQIEKLRTPFALEDLPMLEALQRNLPGGNAGERQPVLLQVDAGGALARRILAQKIAEELKDVR